MKVVLVGFVVMVMCVAQIVVVVVVQRDLSGGGGTCSNRVITDVAIKKTASGTRP